MLRGISESSRRHSQALSYVPVAGTLLAGAEREYRLDGLIAEGGEGRVFAVKGRDEVVAKIYKELDLSRKEKLQVMIQRSTRGLRKVSAWPLSPLHDSQDETVGFIMESLVGWEPLHNAYQIRSRLKLLPHHTYAFLVRTARNLATCVHHLHEEGIVIGDLNESNVFVNAKAVVKLIDADSFQIPMRGSRREGQEAGHFAEEGNYACKVGKMELLPPELQGRSLEGLVRTREHDQFSMAVLIFQILVFGRHPFAGTVAHHLDYSLETCIELGYYAYTRNREVPVHPPPHLGLDWMPENVRALFERAFDPRVTVRPTAKDWYFALKELEASLRTCAENPSHLYWKGARSCPWCELEDLWRIALFRPALSDPEQEYEVCEVFAKIQSIPFPADTGSGIVDFDYTSMPAARLTPWQAFFGRASKNWGWFVFCFFQIGNMLFSGHPVWFTMVLVLAILVLVVFAIIFGRSEIMVKRAAKRLGALAEAWKEEADPSLYSSQLAYYGEIARELQDVKSKFERDRQAFIERLHAPELEHYLGKYSILIADAGPIGSDKLSYLHDNGVKTAADISEARFRSLPRILPSQEKLDLVAWRRTLELQFWKSHSYRLTIHQERNLIVEVRKDSDRKRAELDRAPTELMLLAARLRDRQQQLASEAEAQLAVLRHHGPRLLAIEGKRAS